MNSCRRLSRLLCRKQPQQAGKRAFTCAGSHSPLGRSAAHPSLDRNRLPAARSSLIAIGWVVRYLRSVSNRNSPRSGQSYLTAAWSRTIRRTSRSIRDGSIGPPASNPTGRLFPGGTRTDMGAGFVSAFSAALGPAIPFHIAGPISCWRTAWRHSRGKGVWSGGDDFFGPIQLLV